jgi:hypothetical protein
MSRGVTLHKVTQRLSLAAFVPINLRTQVKDRLVQRDEAVKIYTKRKFRLESKLADAGDGGVSSDASVFAFRSYLAIRPEITYYVGDVTLLRGWLGSSTRKYKEVS